MFPKSNHKYHAKKVVADGHTFDSKLEYHRYLFLREAEASGQISNLQLQKKYVLLPAQFKTIQRFGKRGQPLKPRQVCIERECSYYADFTYTLIQNDEFIDPDYRWETTIIEDTKSRATRTEVYRIKRKMILDKYGISIREVTKADEPLVPIQPI